MSKRFVLAPALLLAVTAAGCTEPPGSYPSLAPRLVEKTSGDDPASPTPVAAPDPALDRQIATLTTTLASNNAEFAAGATKAERAARQPGSQSVGSDSWVGAQAALADIDTLRADTLGIQVDLERLATDRGENGAAPYPALDAAREAAQAQLDAQIARIAAIKTILGEK